MEFQGISNNFEPDRGRDPAHKGDDEDNECVLDVSSDEELHKQKTKHRKPSCSMQLCVDIQSTQGRTCQKMVRMQNARPTRFRKTCKYLTKLEAKADTCIVPALRTVNTPKRKPRKISQASGTSGLKEHSLNLKIMASRLRLQQSLTQEAWLCLPLAQVSQ